MSALFAGLTWQNEMDLTAALRGKVRFMAEHHVESVTLHGADLEEKLRRAGTAVLKVGDTGYLGLLEVAGRHAVILNPDLTVRRVALAQIADALLESQAGLMWAEADRLLESCGTAERRKARRAILRERLQNRRLGTLHILATDPGTSFTRQLRDAGLGRTLAGFITGHTLETVLWIVIWAAAGQAALSGRVDTGWMLGWALLLAALAPARVWTRLSEGRLAIGLSGFLKQRLITGALRLDPDEVAQDGAGRFFSRIAEASSFETLGLSGGLLAAISLVEFPFAAAVLWRGADGGLLIAFLGAWLAVTGAVVWRGMLARAHWTEARLSLTHDAVERMTGHRTRLAQEAPERLHEGEDAALERYHVASARMDRWNVCISTLIPRGWLVLGIAGLMPGFMGRASAADMAIAMWGVLLAQQALSQVAAGISNLAGAAIAWRCVAPMFHAAGAMEPPCTITPVPARTLANATDIVFRYPNNARAVLDGVSLRIDRGDWVLLEGRSGDGKSTLLSVLAGMRQPCGGVLTSGGLDLGALGTRGWRERIAAAPQYHENHILAAPLAFNLLLGRAWPPSQEDLAEAAEVSKELGLDKVIERMPSGLHQMVGDTGWQLSQGERSRVFLARALLQKSEMVILDETFGALDPENLRQAMECTLRRAKTVLVAAHP